jgi:O-antigen ligase
MGRKSMEIKERLDQWIDEAIVILFAAMLIFMPALFGGTHVGAFAAAEIVVTVTLLLWGAKLWLKPSHRLFFSPVVWAVLGLTAYAAIEYMRAPIEFNTRKEVLKAILYCSVFFIFINNLRRRRHVKIFAFCLIGIATLISFYAIGQFLSGSTQILWETQAPIYAHRASGTYICPNHLAGLLAMVVPLALALTLVGRLEQHHKLLLGFATLVMLAGVAVTISRGGYIAALAAVAIVLGIFFQRPKYRIPSLFVAAILACGMVWFFMSTPPEIGSRFEQLTHSSQLQEGRGALYQSNLKMAAQTPLLGWGPGSYSSTVHQFLPENVQSDPLYAHSDYLQFYIEWGVIGLAGLLTLMTLAGIGGSQAWRYVRQRGSSLDPRDSTRTALFLGTVAGLIAIALHSLIDFNMHIPANAIVAVVLLAFLTSSLRYGRKSYWVKQSLPVRLIVSLFILLFAGILFWNSLLTLKSWSLSRRAAEPTLTVSEQAELLSDAQNLDKENWKIALQRGNLLLNDALSQEDPELLEWELSEAARSYRQGIENNHFEYRLFGGMAMVLTLQGQYDEAQACSEKMMKLRPNGSDTSAIHGWCALYRGDYELALNYLERSIHLKNEGNDFAKDWYEIAAKRLGAQKNLN